MNESYPFWQAGFLQLCQKHWHLKVLSSVHVLKFIKDELCESLV